LQLLMEVIVVPNAVPLTSAKPSLWLMDNVGSTRTQATGNIRQGQFQEVLPT